MDDQKTPSNLPQDMRQGRIFLFLFVFFIVGGIVTKRVFGHPEWMMCWHLPGAVFLVLGGKKLTAHQRRSYFQKKFKLR